MGLRIPLLADFVEHSLNKLFYHMGWYVGLRPLPFLIIPLFITAILSTGLVKMRIEDNLRVLYTPIQAPSREEARVYDNFLHPTNNQETPAHEVGYIEILFSVDHDSDLNLLHKNRSDFILEFDKNVTSRLNYTYNGILYNFGQRMCNGTDYWCGFNNKPLFIYLNILSHKNWLSNPNIRCEYPVLEAFGNKVFLGYHFLGVPREQNRSELLQEAKLIRLHYWIDLTSKNLTTTEFEAFIGSLRIYAESVRGTHDVDIILMNQEITNHEVQLNTIACMPFVALTLLALIIFTVLSTITSDLVTSKPWEAFLGVVACFMAILSTLGLGFYLGLSLNTTVSVMPFLAFAIGIDDTFIALNAWHETDSSLPPHKRLALSLRESGTAITVTSLTDVVLFGLCALSSTPAIIVFSTFTAIAMAFDYIYQLTFFTAVMAYAGRREAKKINAYIPVCCQKYRKSIDGKSINRQKSPDQENSIGQNSIDRKKSTDRNSIDQENSIGQEKKKSTIQKIFKSTSASASKLSISRLIKTKLAPFLNNPFVKIIVFIFYLIYIAVASYGVFRIKIDMSASKTVLDDSSIQNFFILQRKYLWEDVRAQIVIQNAPDFRNEYEQDLFRSFLDEMESLPYSRGPASTDIWYRDFQNYAQYIDHRPDEFYKYVKYFLELAVHSHHIGFLHWKFENGSTYQDDPNATISSFFFTSGFTALEAGWEGRLGLLQAWRNLTAYYPQYNMSFYDWDSFFVDQYDTLDDETIQQVGIALLGMTGMAAIFIPNMSSIFWISWTLLSMDFGIIGFLMLWGCDLDPITMMNIVMSLDFAVEYAAHICHRYYISKELRDDDKLVDTLGAIGWPVMQGAMAAIIAILPLTFVHSYIVRAFYKTVILVVAIGLIHAIIWLPIFVSTVNGNNDPSWRKMRKKLKMKNDKE